MQAITRSNEPPRPLDRLYLNHIKPRSKQVAGFIRTKIASRRVATPAEIKPLVDKYAAPKKA